jgi:uncharacterized membrane protein
MSGSDPTQATTAFTALGLGIGLVLGGLVGLLVGNPIIFAGGGLVLGLAIGSALDKSD